MASHHPTLNAEIHAIGAKLEKAKRRHAAEPANVNRKRALDKLEIALEAAIARGLAGMVTPARDRNGHRSKVKGHADYFNTSNVRSVGL